MKKIGIFVEGQTERIFVVRFLIEYLGGEHKFSRIEVKLKNKNRTEIISKRDYPEVNYFFLIFDCAGDGNVLPALYNRAENMIIENNFSFLIALQDLYDRPREKKITVINHFFEAIDRFDFKNKLRFVLAIMELEAWFLADPFVFQKISSELKPIIINNSLDIDLLNINPELFPHPAQTINNIYGLIGKTYKKTEDQAYQIINRLDYDLICSDNTTKKIRSLRYFIEKIDESLMI